MTEVVKATERSRRFRERRRRGVIAVVPVEIVRTDPWVFNKAGLLDPEDLQSGDRQALRDAVHEVLNRWVDSVYDKVAAKRSGPGGK